jgi:hypothetical protein
LFTKCFSIFLTATEKHNWIGGWGDAHKTIDAGSQISLEGGARLKLEENEGKCQFTDAPTADLDGHNDGQRFENWLPTAYTCDVNASFRSIFLVEWITVFLY